MQSSQTAFQEQNINGPELGDEELFKALNDDMPDGMGDFNDIFTWPDAEAGGVRSPTGSPRARGGDSSHPGSPSCIPGPDDHHSPFPCNGPSRVSFILILLFFTLRAIEFVMHTTTHFMGFLKNINLFQQKNIFC